MLARIGYLIRSSTGSKAQPLAARLPPELISHILTFIHDEDDVSRPRAASLSLFFIALARMCRGWYHPVSAYIYANAAPATFRSCELLIRSLDDNPQLFEIVKSLTIPKDSRLFSIESFAYQTPNLIQILVGKCPNLVELRIPMNSSFLWTNDLLQTHLPSMKQLSNLKRLEISTFNVLNPSRDMRFIPAEYVSMWLLQVPSLPQLERLTLSGVAFSTRSYRWPSLPCLRCLCLDRPWYSLEETDISLLSEVRGSLKALHVTGLFEGENTRTPFGTVFPLIHRVASTLEELTIVSPGPSFPFLLPDLWLRNGVKNMTSLRRLHISSQFYHPILLTKLPPLLDTLVITINGSQSSEFNLRQLFRLLPDTVKNLVIRVLGYLSDIDDYDVAIPYHLYPEIPLGEQNFKSEMYRIAHEQGINFRLEGRDDPTFCLPDHSKFWMIRCQSRLMKFLKKLRISR